MPKRFSEKEKEFMTRALALARRGMGKTSPNPMVGAVVVKNGRIVGEGYHHRCGAAHAEVIALEGAGKQARGSEIYLNLEPCSHFGRTPPCVNALISAKIKRVVASISDPDSRVAGKGFRRLRSAGMHVDVGLMREEALQINEMYLKHARTRLPWVTIKAAVTLDGKVATKTGDSKWISSERSRQRVQTLRFRHDAILVGIRTVLKDDPKLTIRRSGKPNWTRVILDPRLETPPHARLFKAKAGGQVIIFTRQGVSGRARRLESKGAEVVPVPGKGDILDLQAVLRALSHRDIMAVFVEGGARVITSFVTQKLADKAVFFIAPKLVGHDGYQIVLFPGPDRMKNAVELKKAHVSRIGSNAVIEGYL
ncbi:bifunctional diaminohydroxyphosphoribosylaminopyrimidine deaminase/5-amino-6-(5-phosphoribosylamino)uracil reductase RibD [Acidobacteriota bacterium]